MKKHVFSAVAILYCLCFGLTSCSKDVVEEDPIIKGPVTVSKVKGLAEIGPFLGNSSVKVYELDDKLNGTGRVFEKKTDDDLGNFMVEPSTEFVSPYVKLAVSGYYFNEHSGKRSEESIELEAITAITKGENAEVNINVLTHLEMPRVMYLVNEKGKSFGEAKKQATKELLDAFLITNKEIKPEEATISRANTDSEILIAISSILLNKRSDAEFSDFLNSIRNDLKEDGSIGPDNKQKIAESSAGLSYTNVKRNLTNRYQEFGKEITIGKFELFIDGNGDGKIGDPYDEEPLTIITPEGFYKTEQDFIMVLNASAGDLFKYLQDQYLFDGVYTRTVSEDQLNDSELRSIFAHELDAGQKITNQLWESAYRAIQKDNHIIDNAEKVKADWAPKYKSFSQTLRAYKYLNMMNLWGGVVLMTKAGMDSMDEAYKPRATRDEVLSFVITTLDEAVKNLPEESYQAQCSKYFAMSLLAKAYLQKNDYNRALNYANQVINSGKFALSTNYHSIFAGGSKEAIFELPDNNEYSSDPYQRLIKKGNNITLSRYAEILLIASEANWKSGNTQQALALLNQVRARNGRSAISLSSDIQAGLIEEWSNDLKNEGLLFATLKRLGVAKQVLGISDTGLLLPIPHRELMVNPSMTQNPGY